MGRDSDREIDIVFIKPKKFEETGKCISHIDNDRIVHIDLQYIPEKDSQRTLDYISGAVYIKDGKIKKLGAKIFCTIPRDKTYFFEYPHEANNFSYGDDEEEEIIPFRDK